MIEPAAEDPCQDCLDTIGKLCHRHEKEILPQLARNIGWLKLIGEARIEQTKRQAAQDDATAIAKAKRRTQRKLARKGYAGLALAILAA